MSLLEAIRSALSAIARERAAQRPDDARHRHRRRRRHRHGRDRLGRAQRVDRQIKSLGANLAIILSGNVTQGGVRLGAGAASTLTDEDADAIRREIDGRHGRGTRSSAARPRSSSRRAELVDAGHGDRRSTTSRRANGRSEAGAAVRARGDAPGEIVAVIGQTVARNLFGERTRSGQHDPRPQRALQGHRRAWPPRASRLSGRTRTTSIFVPLDAGRRRVIGRNYAKRPLGRRIFVKFANEDEIAPGIAEITRAAAPAPQPAPRTRRTTSRSAT